MESPNIFATKIRAINDAIADVSREGGGKVHVDADVENGHPAYVIEVPPMNNYYLSKRSG